MTPLKELARHGMADISVRAVEFDKPVGNRGLHGGLKATSYKCTITSLFADRPSIVATRPDPDVALQDAIELFLSIFVKKLKVNPVSPGPEPKAKSESKAKPKAAPVDDDFDAGDLI